MCDPCGTGYSADSAVPPASTDPRYERSGADTVLDLPWMLPSCKSLEMIKVDIIKAQYNGSHFRPLDYSVRLQWVEESAVH